MSWNLSTVCEALISKGENTELFDRYLMDILVLIAGEKVNVCKNVRDPSLPQFIQLALKPFLRIASSADETFILNTLEIISFFKKLFVMHPTFLDVTAVNFPIELVLPSILAIKNTEFSGALANFVAEIVASTSITLKTSTAAKTLLRCILDMIEIPALSGPALVIFAGLIKSSPVFVTTVKSSSDLRRIKAFLTNTLAGDDHLSAVGAIASLVLLFPRSVDVDIAKVAASHAISVSNDSMLMLKAATWIMIEVARDLGLTSDDIRTLLKTAIGSSAAKAFVLFETINSVIANGGNSLIPENFKIEHVVAHLLGQTTGFVAFSAVRLVEQIMEQRDSVFDDIDDVESLAIKALELASSPSLSVDIDLIECAIVVLRFMVSSESCFAKMRRLLELNEEGIFVAFQRNVEANRSFASLGLFLFLSVAAKQIRGWGRRLRLVIIDSQFGALLAHVVERSTDRRTLSDGIRAIAIISTYSIESDLSERELLLDNIVTGFSVVNTQMKKDEMERTSSAASHIAKQDEEIAELRGQIEIHEMELQANVVRAHEIDSQRQQVQDHADELAEKLNAEKKRATALEMTAETQNSEIAGLKRENETLKRENAEQKLQIEKMMSRMAEMEARLDNLTEKNNQRLKTERDNAQYEQKVDLMNQSLEEMRRQLTAQTERANDYKNKVKTLKDALVAQSESAQKAHTESEKQSVELQGLQQRIDDTNRAREAEHEKYQLVKAKLREMQQKMERMRQQEVELRTEIVSLNQSNKENSEKVAELTAQQKQWELITQFIHRITDDTPVPSEQLMALFEGQ